ncbi:MAG TPA: hypothetical protein VIK55_09855 [Paludibacter sp.]
MNKLKIDLEYCYGVKKLNYEFDFTIKPTYAIYAPNGIMKTSFLPPPLTNLRIYLKSI